MSKRHLLATLFALTCAAACGGSERPPDWPEGSYCVLRYGSCPRAANGDFVEGTFVIDTDDEGADISSFEAAGSSTAGDDSHARLELCCGEFGPGDAEFPDEPFALFAGGNQFEPQCPAGFAGGEVFIDAEDDTFGEDADTRLEGESGGAVLSDAGNITLRVCESTPGGAGDFMPDDQYCVLGGDDDACPADFEPGYLVTDDEDSGNIDMIVGEVGGITQADTSTYFPFCCQ